MGSLQLRSLHTNHGRSHVIDIQMDRTALLSRTHPDHGQRSSKEGVAPNENKAVSSARDVKVHLCDRGIQHAVCNMVERDEDTGVGAPCMELPPWDCIVGLVPSGICATESRDQQE